MQIHLLDVISIEGKCIRVPMEFGQEKIHIQDLDYEVLKRFPGELEITKAKRFLL